MADLNDSINPDTKVDQPSKLNRPIKPKYQVFVSSTFQDLRDERESVTWEILKAGHIPVGMENFSADDDRGWKIIERTLMTTDYYVLILAGRYGSIDNSIGMSWTEREYKFALELGIPILAFIRDKKHIPGDKIDIDEKAKHLENLINDVSGRILRENWTTVDDLRSKVAMSLFKRILEDENYGTPRLGWYRGNQLSSQQVTDEIARLSRENFEYRDEIAKLRIIYSDTNSNKFELLDKSGDQVVNLHFKRPKLSLNSDSFEQSQSPTSGELDEKTQEYIDNLNSTIWMQFSIKNLGVVSTFRLIN
jgi:Domain of unknown function (DUF4062)